jgi:hypothetical protein
LTSGSYLGNSTQLSWDAGTALLIHCSTKQRLQQPGMKFRISRPIPIHQNLTPNTNYVWKIQAACAGGTTSTYSGEGAFNSGFAPVTSPGPRSLSFNGSTQYLNAGQFNLNGNALTFEGWVKVNALKQLPLYFINHRY